MDTMKVLLGATIGLLVAFVVLAFTNLDKERSAELEELRLQNAQLKAAPAVVVQPLPTVAPQAAAKVPAETQKELDRLKAELQAANDEALRRAEAAAKLAAESQAPDPVLDEPTTLPAKMEKRALAVQNALLLGTVSSYNEDFNLVSFSITREGMIDRGMTIGIRRNTGIVGRIKVTDLEAGSGIGEAVIGTFLGGLDIQVGDELIIPPL